MTFASWHEGYGCSGTLDGDSQNLDQAIPSRSDPVEVQRAHPRIVEAIEAGNDSLAR